MRPSFIVAREQAMDLNRQKDLITLSTEFIPAYLRWAEHVFGNLMQVYWSVTKKGAVEGRFDLRGATTLFRSKRLDSLLSGYSDKVRNA
ncbi:MAG: hypothetical protein ACC700_19735, partial [Anaerolineales bacterium]